MKVTTAKTKANFIVGRGKVYVNGQYLANTADLKVTVSRKNKMRLSFEGHDISKSLLEKLFTLDSASINFHADNAAGKNVNYSFPKVEFKRSINLHSGDEFQGVKFEGKVVPVDGLFGSYDYPDTYEIRL